MAALHEFLAANRNEILERCTEKIVASSAEAALRKQELTDDLPRYFDDIVGVLRRAAGLPSDSSLPDASAAAVEHGRQRFQLGFDIGEVVHDYGAMCDSITDVAMRKQQSFSVEEYQMLNRALDAGIAKSVQQYTSVHDASAEQRNASNLGFVAHELRNALAAATMSFKMIKDGKVPVAGRTADVVARSHERLTDLVGRLLARVTLRAGLLERRELRVAQLLEEVEAASTLESRARGIAVRVQVDPTLCLVGDRQLLFSAVRNLMHNAIKFSHAGGTITLRGEGRDGAITIEIEDACGGLPDGKAEELFTPYVKRGDDRSGLGLGLAIVKESAERHGGRVNVRNLPGKGCVFTIVLPRDSDGGERREPA